jgi:hypothetical protein
MTPWWARWEVRMVVRPLSGTDDRLWGTTLGAVSWHVTKRAAVQTKLMLDHANIGRSVFENVVERKTYHRDQFHEVITRREEGRP